MGVGVVLYWEYVRDCRSGRGLGGWTVLCDLSEHVSGPVSRQPRHHHLRHSGSALNIRSRSYMWRFMMSKAPEGPRNKCAKQTVYIHVQVRSKQVAGK